jgi:hypothetical protein
MEKFPEPPNPLNGITITPYVAPTIDELVESLKIPPVHKAGFDYFLGVLEWCELNWQGYEHSKLKFLTWFKGNNLNSRLPIYIFLNDPNEYPNFYKLVEYFEENKWISPVSFRAYLEGK